MASTASTHLLMCSERRGTSHQTNKVARSCALQLFPSGAVAYMINCINYSWFVSRTRQSHSDHNECRLRVSDGSPKGWRRLFAAPFTTARPDGDANQQQQSK
jgi:hypothetical protein